MHKQYVHISHESYSLMNQPVEVVPYNIERQHQHQRVCDGFQSTSRYDGEICRSSRFVKNCNGETRAGLFKKTCEAGFQHYLVLRPIRMHDVSDALDWELGAGFHFSSFWTSYERAFAGYTTVGVSDWLINQICSNGDLCD